MGRVYRRLGAVTCATALFAVSAGIATAGPVEETVYVQSGDVTAREAVVWARCNRGEPARLVVRLATERDGLTLDGSIRTRTGPVVSADTDFTGSVPIVGLQPDTRYYYTVACAKEPVGAGEADVSGLARFHTAPGDLQARNVRFVWYADVAGQGWGRNPSLSITSTDGDAITGGFVGFETMTRLHPDFGVNVGDAIYADGRIPASVSLPQEVGGGTWINEPTKDFPALTLDAFRTNWRYNLGDATMRRFLRQTPVVSQWDDHEVLNNWWPGQVLESPPYAPEYAGVRVDDLVPLARQALFEYNPIGAKTIYRKLRYGKHLELFVLDERSYRGPNPDNYAPAGNEMLGKAQFAWLKRSLKQSKATWKVISTDDPLSIVTGGPTDRDAWGQGETAVLGREVQLAQLLGFIKTEGIKNVVFITADVHYAASINYDPARAQFADFNPFWEFVVGPLHAGSFGPNDLDPSFGPSYEYLRAPGTEGFTIQNLPPPNLQSFGALDINWRGKLTARIHDVTGAVLYEKTLDPQ